MRVATMSLEACERDQADIESHVREIVDLFRSASCEEEETVMVTRFLREQRATGLREAHAMMEEWYCGDGISDVEEVIETLEDRACEMEEAA